MKTMRANFRYLPLGVLALTFSLVVLAGEVGPPQPLAPCRPASCSSSRMAGFEAAVAKLQSTHRANAGLRALLQRLHGKVPNAQNGEIQGFFQIDSSMDIEDIEAAIARRTVHGQDDPLSPGEVGMLADLWVGAKE